MNCISKINLSLISQLDIIHKIAKGLQDMLNENLVHCDIKPGNIVFEGEFDVKLIDLGSACFIDSKEIYTVGTIEYQDPSQMDLSQQYVCVHENTDVWSLGIIILEMNDDFYVKEMGKLRRLDNIEDKYEEVLEIIPRLLEDAKVNPNLQNSLCKFAFEKMLIINPKSRCLVKDVIKFTKSL